MANKITIKVTKTAFYDGGLVYPNEIIKNYKGETIPSWATLANSKDAPVKDEEDKAPKANVLEKCKPCYMDGKVPSDADCANCKAKEAETEVVTAGDDGVYETSIKQTQEAIIEEYNALLDEAVDKNILLEDADKKTMIEQIAELKTILGKK